MLYVVAACCLAVCGDMLYVVSACYFAVCGDMVGTPDESFPDSKIEWVFK